MNAVIATRAARRRALAFVLLLAASLGLMALSGNRLVVELQQGIDYAFRPMQSALSGFGHDLGSIGTALSEIDQLRTENEALRAEIDRIRSDSQQAEELRRENELLTGLLQLQSGFEHKTVAVTVIARDSSEAQRRVIIDRGTADGLEIGDVVIAAGGALVGRVVAAGAATATVQLVTDSGSTVIGQLITSAATGEVSGELPGSLRMENIDSSVSVALGEEVVTAGIELAGGIRSPYPKGLVIGRVIDVHRDANEIVQTAFIEPAAPLDRLEYLLVIIDYRGGIPGIDEFPVDCTPDENGTVSGGEQPCIEPTASPGASQ